MIYVPEGITNKVTTLYNPSMDHYLTAMSDTVEMTTVSSAKSLWKLQQVNVGTFRIVSQYYSDKCLALTSSGKVTFVDIANYTTDTSQLWYVTVSSGKYWISNEKYGWELYATEDSDGNVICRGSSIVVSEKIEWKMRSLAPEHSTVLYNYGTNTYLTASTESKIEMLEEATEKSVWVYELISSGKYQVVSQYYPNICLASDASGNLTLAATATSFDDSNQNQLWYISTENEIYSFINVQYEGNLYSQVDSDGKIQVSIDITDSVTSEKERWTLMSLVPGIRNTGKMLYNAQTDSYLTATSETAVSMTATAKLELLWKCVLTIHGGYQIIPLSYPDKCLASDASGNLTLVIAETSFDSSNQNQLWYISVEKEKHTITNMKYGFDLYSQSTAENTVVCGIDVSDTCAEEEKKWARLDYVCSIKNVDIGRSLKNYDGKNYDGEYIRLGTYEYNPLYDKYGFRMVYHVKHDAYMMMPISSSNGYYRALTMSSTEATGADNISTLHSVTTTEQPKQLFTVELQDNGEYVIRLKANPNLYLTGYLDNYCARMYEQTTDLEKQTWTFSVYEYTLPSGVKDTYAEVEHYYRSQGLGSPFGNEWDLTVVSDYGIRYLNSSNPNDLHRGIDLRTWNDERTQHERNLYAPFSGVVVDKGLSSSMGYFVKIDTGIPAYEGSTYTICIVYMHMNSINNELVDHDGDGIIEVDKGTRLGVSGNTGSSGGPHLHYGVFLNSGSGYDHNALPLNPLWFITGYENDISKTS